MFSTYRLPGKLPDEKIIKFIRRDYFVLGKKLSLFFVLAVFPFIFFYLIETFSPEFLAGEIVYPLAVLGGSAYYLFVWLFFFFSLIDYYLDIWIITSERIIDIRQQGFFSRVISEQRLDRVQDVSSEVRGIFPTVFKYGNVEVQTAGEQGKFLFCEIPNPEETRNLIIKMARGKTHIT